MIISNIQSAMHLSKQVLLGSILLGSTGIGALANADSLPDFATIVDKEGQAVVNIAVTSAVQPAALSNQPDLEQIPEQYRKFFEQQNPRSRREPRSSGGVGSGFIVSEDGYILTNAHVVNDATGIVVRLRDRTELTATLIGLDELTDVALIKVDADNLPVVKIASADDVAVGEWVLAIGSPFGFDQTATQGIVSAVSRNLPSANYVPFIQTDAAVNPGNSGGPLFNTDGEVIGINSQIYSSTGGYQGLSFAIPIDLAMNVAEQLKESGQTSRGWLGVGIQDVSPDLAESFGLGRVTGALVSSVSGGSPAEQAGIKEGDIVLEFNGKAVNRSGELPSLVGAVRRGKSAVVTVFRNGENKDLNVTIGQRGNESAAAAPVNDTTLGMKLAELTSEELQPLDIEQGVKVVQVAQSSIAEGAGLVAGDIIVQMNGIETGTVQQVLSTAKSLPVGKPIPVLVQRSGNAIFLTLKLSETME